MGERQSKNPILWMTYFLNDPLFEHVSEVKKWITKSEKKKTKKQKNGVYIFTRSWVIYI